MYFQSILVPTASAASRSVRFSARCSTVTSASRDGGPPLTAPGTERGRETLIPQPLARLVADQHRQ